MSHLIKIVKFKIQKKNLKLEKIPKKSKKLEKAAPLESATKKI